MESTKKIRTTLQAMAQAPQIQEALFPDFVEVADELALEWEECLALLEPDHPGFTNEQWSLIEALDCYILSKSGRENAHLWSEEALFNSVEWQTIRQKAKDVLIAMGWSLDIPLLDNAKYIGRKK